MNWLLPIVLVLFAGIVFAAGHFVFVRWMARISEPAPVAEDRAPERQGRSTD